MPGSTASSKDSANAKVTKNGLFVRPVAVAGIFRPADEGSSKPPAIPEKRRFSALVGDFTPCSSVGGAAVNDFARRRQSWDIRQKEVPFGQALLKRTPRNTCAPGSHSAAKVEEAKNSSVGAEGSSTSAKSENRSLLSPERATDLSSKSQVSEGKNEGDNKKISLYTKDNLQSCSVTEELNQDGKNSVKQETSKRSTHQSGPNATFPAEPKIEKVPDNTSKNSSLIVTPSSNVSQAGNGSVTVNASETKIPPCLSENAKQPKKVYGLMKRDSKAEILTSKSECVLQKENASSNSSPADSSSKSKTKIYGIKKVTPKKEVENECPVKREVTPKTVAESVNVVSSQSAGNLVPSEPKSEPLKDISKSFESKVAVGPAESLKESTRSHSPPKDFRTVRRTSDVIAAKIQNIFSNLSSTEKPSPLVLKKTKTSDNVCCSATDKTSVTAKVSARPALDKSGESDNQVEKNSVPNSTVVDSFSVLRAKGVASDAKSSDFESKKTRNSPEKTNIKPGFKHVEKSNVVDVNNEIDAVTQDNGQKQLHRSTILRKEKPILSSISNAQQFSEVLNTQCFKTDSLLKKADSKSAHSISVLSSDFKSVSTEGKMPAKNSDLNSSDVTDLSLIATSQEIDHDFAVTTASQNISKDECSKGNVTKKEPVITSAKRLSLADRKISTTTTYSRVLNNSVSKLAQNANMNDCRKTDDKQKSSQSSISIVESSASNSSVLSSCGAVKKTDSSRSSSKLSCKVDTSEISKTCLNGAVGTDEISKIEVTKINPIVTPGIVPTVNVLFRTKSPQSVTTREENRKKIVIEADGPSATSDVISPLNVSEKLASDSKSLLSATKSVNEALKAVEGVYHSMSSSPAKHTIVNLQNEELATVTLAPNRDNICNKPSSVNENNASEKRDSQNRGLEGQCDITLDEEKNRKFDINNSDTKTSSISFTKDIGNETKTSDSSQNKMAVVDLVDWSKKFQRVEPEAPRAPLRRRAQRDSLPPRSSSRCGSLKRIEDSPRYLPRSTSQSSLPQRYSYTEMLSRVCSVGVLPYVEPFNSKSCSSSSSQVSELWSELSEEQSAATHASEILEAETTERMRLEKEVQELQNRYSQVQQRSDKMEMEIMEARVYRTPELNGDLSDDEPDGAGSLYKQKYERAVRDMEIMKRRTQQQHEEEMEQKDMLKKASDKRLAEALEDVEEERQVANQWKRKAQKLGSELQDLRLMLEEQMGRNGELEKKQRRFDAELSTAQEEIKKERFLREKLIREKDQAIHEKYSIEQDLHSAKLDSDMLHEKIAQLNREIDELTLSSKGEEEVTQLKRAKQELERKTRDQEEELEELAAQVQMLEQAKLRLEMSLEKVRQEHRREASVREEEIEEIRASFSKKVKNLEAQLESEQDERHQLVKQKHELERHIYEIADQPPPHDPEVERRLRRDLKRTKALLKDAQSMLEHTRDGQSGKTLIRQLKNQLEDSEFAKATAIKARQAVESELQECQLQLEEVTRAKNDAESRCLQLSREKSAIQTQLEETEEEMAEVMKKYKAVVAQMSIDQKALSEQNQQISELEIERQMLKDQLSEVSHKFEHLVGQSEDTQKVHRLDSKVRDLESKLELEQTTRARLEHQISRLKEQNDRAREECDALRNKELQAQEAVRRFQRQVRDLREDYSALQQKEADAYRKQHELEMALENTETDLQVTKNDLRLACQRIQDLQNALEDDLDSGTDVPDDSGSDSDSSFELSMFRNQSLTPVQRCDSVASNLSYDVEGHRSRTSSFGRDMSSFSSRNDAEKDINGFSGLNSSCRLDTEHDETI